VEPEASSAFAVWVTGLPACGKSTLVAHLRTQLAARGVRAAALESDALRPILTPGASYGPAGRDAFYQCLVSLGVLLAGQGIPVLFDATANRRAYRDQARRQLPRFCEVYVQCPLAVCMARDPKGIYRRAAQGASATVPGLQVPYEPPEHPDMIVDGEIESMEGAARRVLAWLAEKEWIPCSVAHSP
jgi:adenylylsulfate kinase